MLARVLARSVECHCRQCILHKFANTPSKLQESKLGTLLNLPNLAQQWLKKIGCWQFWMICLRDAKLAWWVFGTLLVVQICFANWQITLKRSWIQQQICFMFKLHGCWPLYFGTASAKSLGDCQIFDISSNNILDLLGLTNLGTKCEEVVCKYEHVRELSICNCIPFCILHFASCIWQNLPMAKTDFFKRIHKVDLRL